jgi:hypothetical protein
MEKTADMFAAMQADKPHSIFKKGILGKVALNVLNPWSGEPEVVILQGVPERNDDGCFFKTYSVEATLFIKNMNKPLFDKGAILEVKQQEKKPKSEAAKLNSATDDELDKILNTPWLGFTAKVNKMTSSAPVYRLLVLAREQEKSESYTKFLEEKLAELEVS